MPASLFAFAILARSDPLGAPALFCTPAFVLADDQRLPNASPPVACPAFDAGLPSVAADVDDAYESWFDDATDGRAVNADVAEGTMLIDAEIDV